MSMLSRSLAAVACTGALSFALCWTMFSPGPAAARPPERRAKHPIAACDIWTIGYELAMSDRFREDDARTKAEYDKDVAPLYEEARRLYERLDELEDREETEEYRKAYGEYYEARERYEERSREFSERQSKEFSQRLSRCCADARQAAEDIAHDEGFDYVLASCDPVAHVRLGEQVREMRRDRRAEYRRGGGPAADQDEAEEDSDPYHDVYYSERYRTVVVAPPDTNIDDLVRERLRLPRLMREGR